MSGSLSYIDWKMSRGKAFSDIAFIYKAQVVAGIFAFLLAVYCFFVRQALAHYAKVGPRMLSILLWLGIVWVVSYNGVVLDYVQNIEDLVLDTVVITVLSCLENLILYFSCKAYFQRRMHIFDKLDYGKDRIPFGAGKATSFCPTTFKQDFPNFK